jgi:hypothetical protein
MLTHVGCREGSRVVAGRHTCMHACSGTWLAKRYNGELVVSNGLWMHVFSMFACTRHAWCARPVCRLPAGHIPLQRMTTSSAVDHACLHGETRQTNPCRPLSLCTLLLLHAKAMHACEVCAAVAYLGRGIAADVYCTGSHAPALLEYIHAAFVHARCLSAAS